MPMHSYGTVWRRMRRRHREMSACMTRSNIRPSRARGRRPQCGKQGPRPTGAREGVGAGPREGEGTHRRTSSASLPRALGYSGRDTRQATRLGRLDAGSGRFGACAATARRYAERGRQPPARAHLVVLDCAQQLAQRRRQRRDQSVRGANRLLVAVLVLQAGHQFRMPQLGCVEKGASLCARQVAVLKRSEQRRVLGSLYGRALHCGAAEVTPGRRRSRHWASG